MGLKDWLGIGDTIAKPIQAVGELYTTDKARIEAEAKLEEVTQKTALAQIELNRTFALSGRFFESAWQPLCGWTAGACLFLYWVPQLVFVDYMWMMACIDSGEILRFPLAADDINQLVYLVFGFGAYHIVKRKVLS